MSQRTMSTLDQIDIAHAKHACALISHLSESRYRAEPVLGLARDEAAKVVRGNLRAPLQDAISFLADMYGIELPK